MDYFDGLRKSVAVKAAEQNGDIADSMDVRMKLMARVEDGEITLEEAQKQLRKIKRTAKKHGKSTRNSVFVNS